MNATKTRKTPSRELLRRARKLAEKLADEIEPMPEGWSGRGIVICGGGYTHFTNAWVVIRMLRHLGCRLPIELWHLGSAEINDRMKRMVAKYQVDCVDGLSAMRRTPGFAGKHVNLGHVLKSVALARCRFEEVMLIDADNLPIRDPSFLFDTYEYKMTGALFWPDFREDSNHSLWDVFRPPHKKEPTAESGRFFIAKQLPWEISGKTRDEALNNEMLWRVSRVPRDEAPAIDSGQLLLDKRRHWEPLALAESMNLYGDTFYLVFGGERHSYRYAWHKLGRPFAMPQSEPEILEVSGIESRIVCQPDFEGVRLFQHRIAPKWDFLGENPWIAGFFFESDCRRFLQDLKRIWDGRCVGKSPIARTEAARRHERELLNQVWLLEVPEAIQKQYPERRFVDKLWEKGAVWWELRFHTNGTLRTGRKEIGYFWDLQRDLRGLVLVISDGNQARVLLRRKGAGWEGLWRNERTRSNTKMMPLHEVYPHLATKPLARTARQKIRGCFGEEVHLVHTTEGIGDHVAAVYTCTGLVRTGVRVVFHTPCAAWFARVRERGLTISATMRKHYDYNLRYDYSNEIKYGTSRALWYAGGLHPLLKPATPHVDRRIDQPRLPFDRYVVIAPYAHHPNREWLDLHWVRLAELLREAGCEVVAITGLQQAERLQKTFNNSQVYWAANHPPEWVLDAILGAAAFVGLDSGMTHVAALMGVKPVAIYAQLEPEFLWANGAAHSVIPKARCVFCHWQAKAGCANSCEEGCSALATVNPETVFDAVMSRMSLSGNKGRSIPSYELHCQMFP
jgi:hypothetical protein